LGSNDLQLIEEAIAAHIEDRQPPAGMDGARCLRVIRAMCYQVSKEICALSAVVCGRVDGVVLTGGMAWDRRIVEEIRERVSFLGPFLVFPGENEMEALALAAHGALSGTEPILEYAAAGFRREP
jgi:butyrate kinase